jgi:DNA-binding transcriptional LysR family regulator
MDTRFVESFLIAVDHGSIAEAARRLNLTAPAVAKRIRALENEVGAILVKRSGRTIRATEAGAAIVEHARRFLIEARDFTSIAATDRPSGQLHLGAYQSALSSQLPDILALMKEKYPQIDVHIVSGSSSELYRRVLDGDALDAAIIAQPPFALPKSCGWRLLRKDPLVLVAPESMASRRPYDILASEPFIRLDRNLWPGRLADGYLRKAGIRPQERFEIDGGAAIAVMVNRGLGVSILPDWAPPWPEGLSVVKLPLPNAGSFARCVGIVWARASRRLGLVHHLLEQAEAARHQRSGPTIANSGLRIATSMKTSAKSRARR